MLEMYAQGLDFYIHQTKSINYLLTKLIKKKQNAVGKCCFLKNTQHPRECDAEKESVIVLKEWGHVHSGLGTILI